MIETLKINETTVWEKEVPIIFKIENFQLKLLFSIQHIFPKLIFTDVQKLMIRFCD
jgi:hypothetical protein